jgi:hypothetical protein
MRSKLLILLCFLVDRTVVRSQGTFQNLDFEAANVSAYSPGSLVPTASAFPGWQALIGTTPTSTVGYDAETLSVASISINNGALIQGSYTAFLQSAVVGSQSTSVTLSQTGLVPTGAESIELDGNEPNGGSFAVTLGGDNITMFPLQTFSGYTLYGGNISAWGGQDASLSITQLAPASENGEYSPSLLELDNITFSTQAIPEASPLVLTGVGGLLFALYRRFAPKRQ